MLDRRSLALTLLFVLVLPAETAVAGPAVSFDAWGGLGDGTAQRDQYRLPGGMSFAGLTGAWRAGSHLAIVGSWDGAGGPAVGVSYATTPRVTSISYSAYSTGVEYRSARNSAVNPFALVTVGLGTLTSEATTPDALNLGYRQGIFRERAFATTFAAGVRLIPRPGPLGVVLELRSAHAIGRSSSMHVTGFALGLTVYPLTPRQREL